MNMIPSCEIIYKSNNLVLFKRKHFINLLSTDHGFFRDENNNLIGNIVRGYITLVEGQKLIEPIYQKVTQVFPDGIVGTWTFNEKGYKRVE